MAWRYWKPPIHTHGGIPNNRIANNKGGNRLRQLLDELHKNKKIEIDLKRFVSDKQYRYSVWGETSRIWQKPLPKEPKLRPCLADDFQRFKKHFVKEYDGDVVQDTGMTHKEFKDYFTTGKREGVEIHSEEYWDSYPDSIWE
jgi:hypothetical protein|tara:strand:- start:43 stop:468 length:426 start_codon:yes stop_codon:yes gene_type:complete